MVKSHLKNLSELYRFDSIIRKEVGTICGIDEAGRGPLAGDVYAAAVILPEGVEFDGLDDSKKLSEKKREQLFDEITEKAVSYCIATASVEEIDTLNILEATMLAMTRAFEGLSVKPDMVLVDGNKAPELSVETDTVVKGDATSASIAAASILAKVAKPKVDKKTDKVTAKVTATINVTGEKKVSIKGDMDVESGVFAAVDKKSDRELYLEFGENGIIGTFDIYEIDGARNLFSSKDKEEKADAEEFLEEYLGSLNMAWEGGTLAVTIAKKGGKVTSVINKTTGKEANLVSASPWFSYLINASGATVQPSEMDVENGRLKTTYKDGTVKVQKVYVK